ncbi:MAG: ABC transporter permease, partial [Gammaproteobacteria bacterium]
MNIRFTLASSKRIFSQLLNDKRTIALLLLFPAILMTLLRFVFDDNERVFDSIGGPMLAVFPFVTMFLVSCIVTLRERASGTLERLMTMPIHKVDIIFGYALSFGIMAFLQAGIAMAVAVKLLGLDIAGEWYWLFAVAGLDAILGMALGLFASSL